MDIQEKPKYPPLVSTDARNKLNRKAQFSWISRNKRYKLSTEPREQQVLFFRKRYFFARVDNQPIWRVEFFRAFAIEGRRTAFAADVIRDVMFRADNLGAFGRFVEVHIVRSVAAVERVVDFLFRQRRHLLRFARVPGKIDFDAVREGQNEPDALFDVMVFVVARLDRLNFDVVEFERLIFAPFERFFPRDRPAAGVAILDFVEIVVIAMSVRDETRMPVPARLPVEIRVFDAAGQELDGAGYVCAEGGVCTLTVRTNLNDPPGGYRIVCRDRASGIVSEVR